MTTRIGMLLYPGLTQLDLTGPFEVLHRLPDTKVHLVWKNTDPITADSGMRFIPDTTMKDCPQLELIMVPGGWGQVELMQDPETLGFLRSRAETARWVTSVCTGSLLLGAAGLLQGYEASTHWAYMELLPLFGAKPVNARVVIDRNRITGGGVTAGIDFALRVAAKLAGDHFAKCIQLGLEYDPAPPFESGHPRVAEPAVIEEMRKRFAPRVQARIDMFDPTKRAVQSLEGGAP